MEIDPSYEVALSGREAWTVGQVAWVAVGLSLRTRSGDAVKDARAVWALLTRAVESKALATVECREPEPAREVRVELSSDPWIRAAQVENLPFNKAYPTRTVPARTHFHEATVRPTDAAAWLRSAGKPAMAARVERIAAALCPKPAESSSFEPIAAGDEPRNLSRASPDDLAEWIASYWARVEAAKPRPKAPDTELKRILQAGGFTKARARTIHAAHKPDWLRPGQTSSKS